MWKKALCVLLCVTNPVESYAKTIRKIEADESRVVGINTALGYSTIIEFQSKPTSAVLGDQDAFKLEYVGNSITVKPLVPHAKSNLFVFTEYDRFNCTLRTGSASEVDYIVKVTAPSKAYPVQAVESEKEPVQKKIVVNRAASFAGYLLKVGSVSRVEGRSQSRAATVIDIELSSKRTRYAFSAGSLGVKQRGRYVAIENLYLDAVELIPGNIPVRGKIVLLAHDLHPAIPFTIVFATLGARKGSKSHRLEVTLGNAGGHKNEKGK